MKIFKLELNLKLDLEFKLEFSFFKFELHSNQTHYKLELEYSKKYVKTL